MAGNNLKRPNRRAQSQMACPQIEKSEAYRTIYALNRSFFLLKENLKRLEDLGIFRVRYLRAFCVMAEELRAGINHELISILREHEERDWAYFGKLHNRWEEQFKDPSDVLLEAKRFKQKLRKAKSR